MGARNLISGSCSAGSLSRDTLVGPLPIDPARSPVLPLESARSLLVRRLGGLVTGAAAAAAGAANARFVVEFQAGDRVTAPEFTRHRDSEPPRPFPRA